jgi:hypothetical protein
VDEQVVLIGFTGEPYASAEELDRLTTDLREELLGLDVQAVERVPSGPAPEWAKGLPASDVAALAVTLSSSAAVLALAGLVRSWSGRTRTAKVTIRLGEHEISVDEASLADTTALIKSWIELHEQRRA